MFFFYDQGNELFRLFKEASAHGKMFFYPPPNSYEFTKSHQFAYEQIAVARREKSKCPLCEAGVPTTLTTIKPDQPTMRLSYDRSEGIEPTFATKYRHAKLKKMIFLSDADRNRIYGIPANPIGEEIVLDDIYQGVMMDFNFEKAREACRIAEDKSMFDMLADATYIPEADTPIIVEEKK